VAERSAAKIENLPVNHRVWVEEDAASADGAFVRGRNVMRRAR